MADLTPLTTAGMDVAGMTTDERTALEGLDQTEIDTLAAIKTKLNGDAEVSGYAMAARGDGGIVW
jgi:hypothetical protein